MRHEDAIPVRLFRRLGALVLVGGLVIDIHATLAAYLVAWIALGSIPIGALGS